MVMRVSFLIDKGQKRKKSWLHTSKERSSSMQGDACAKISIYL